MYEKIFQLVSCSLDLSGNEMNLLLWIIWYYRYYFDLCLDLIEVDKYQFQN